MSAFKGTPGPWSVGAEDADSGEIEVISEARPYVCMVLPGAIDGTTAANARLIAAAPDLLEALVALFNDYKNLADSGDAGFWRLEDFPEGKQALAAIAKATGEQA